MKKYSGNRGRPQTASTYLLPSWAAWYQPARPTRQGSELDPRLRYTTTPDPGTPPPTTGLCALRELAWSQGPSGHQDDWDVTPAPNPQHSSF